MGLRESPNEFHIEFCIIFYDDIKEDILVSCSLFHESCSILDSWGRIQLMFISKNNNASHI